MSIATHQPAMVIGARRGVSKIADLKTAPKLMEGPPPHVEASDFEQLVF